MPKKKTESYPKLRAYIRKTFPEMGEGDIEKALMDIPKGLPDWAALQIFKAIEKEARKGNKIDQIPENKGLE